ncbi:MAG TPA: SxtJ family membrane protein [bacterium]|nr:SxtJ family membrane protein [bacterium]
MKKRDEKKDIRNFGIALAVILLVFAALGFYKDRAYWPYLSGAAGAILVLALFVKPALRPIFKGWMWFAMKLNWLTTRIILTAAWLVMFVPVGLVLRLFRVDFFDRQWQPEAKSYWRVRPDTPYDRRKSERLG